MSDSVTAPPAELGLAPISAGLGAGDKERCYVSLLFLSVPWALVPLTNESPHRVYFQCGLVGNVELRSFLCVSDWRTSCN